MNKKLTLASIVATTLVVGTFGLSTSYAEEVAETFTRMREGAGPMTEIMDNADYAGWQDAIKERLGFNAIQAERLQTTIDAIDSEADFDKMVEAHNLMKEGKTDEAKVIFDELGLPERPNPLGGGGMGQGLGGGEMKGQGQGAGIHRQ